MSGLRASIEAVADSVGLDPLDLAVAMIEDDRQVCEMPDCRFPAEFETLCSDHAGQSPGRVEDCE